MIWIAQVIVDRESHSRHPILHRYTFSAQQKYEQLSYEKAFEYEPEPEDIKLYEIDLEEFKNNIRLFLEGLGPLGYGLLKVSSS
jgi:hypothetical protein